MHASVLLTTACLRDCSAGDQGTLLASRPSQTPQTQWEEPHMVVHTPAQAWGEAFKGNL